jgi:hypothetical protein
MILVFAVVTSFTSCNFINQTPLLQSFLSCCHLPDAIANAVFPSPPKPWRAIHLLSFLLLSSTANWCSSSRLPIKFNSSFGKLLFGHSGSRKLPLGSLFIPRGLLWAALPAGKTLTIKSLLLLTAFHQ